MVGHNVLLNSVFDTVADSVYIGVNASCCITGYTTTGNNVVIGAYAALNSTGCNNTFVGYSVAPTLAYTGSNNTALGNGAEPASAAASNTVTLGNSSITTLRAAVTSITAISDARDKTSVQELPVGIQFVKDLKPVVFQWQYREGNPVKDGTPDAGFLAQDLQEAQVRHKAEYLGLANTENPDRFEATPGRLIPVLVKAIQDLTAAHEKLRQDFDIYRSGHP